MSVQGPASITPPREEVGQAQTLQVPAEMDLREDDLVKMAGAVHGDGPVILVTDIDGGRASTALPGTWALLRSEGRRHLRACCPNRFLGGLPLPGSAAGHGS